MQLCMEIEVVA